MFLDRLNGLLIANQLRSTIAREMSFGRAVVADGFKWPQLDFGWTLAEVCDRSHFKASTL